MPREFSRSRRVEDAIQRILSEALAVRVGDPRLNGISVSHVSVSRDVSVAKVLYSRMNGEAPDAEVAAAFASATGYLRTLIARELRLRKVPELRFLPDEALARARSLEALIEKAVRPTAPSANPPATEGE
jgi:ribosome-binding factor A